MLPFDAGYRLRCWQSYVPSCVWARGAHLESARNLLLLAVKLPSPPVVCIPPTVSCSRPSEPKERRRPPALKTYIKESSPGGSRRGRSNTPRSFRTQYSHKYLNVIQPGSYRRDLPPSHQHADPREPHLLARPDSVPRPSPHARRLLPENPDRRGRGDGPGDGLDAAGQGLPRHGPVQGVGLVRARAAPHVADRGGAVGVPAGRLRAAHGRHLAATFQALEHGERPSPLGPLPDEQALLMNRNVQAKRLARSPTTSGTPSPPPPPRPATTTAGRSSAPASA